MNARSEQLNELATALSAAQAEFTTIPKDSTNPFFKSKYAGLPQVVEVASPVLTKHGLSVSQFPGFDEQGDTLTTWLLHTSGQFIAQEMRLHLTKVDAQGQGSALTYAKRYAYMAALGLVADVDDDGNAAVAAQATAKPQQQTLRAAPNGALHPESRRELSLLATGMTTGQIKLALTAVGIEHPAMGADIFSTVPQTKAALLAEALATAKAGA